MKKHDLALVGFAVRTGDGRRSVRTHGCGILGRIKAALNQAATVAINALGRTDGFMSNPEVRIPLPGSWRRPRRN